MDALPFCPLVRVVRKAASRQLPAPPTTVGAHIKHVRSERKLRQIDAAAQIGATPATIVHWEAGYTAPPVVFMPAIVRFLGYEPWPEAQTLAEKMLAHRRRNGLPIKQAAAQAGVDEETWARYERSGAVHDERCRALIETLIAGQRSPD